MYFSDSTCLNQFLSAIFAIFARSETFKVGLVGDSTQTIFGLCSAKARSTAAKSLMST